MMSAILEHQYYVLRHPVIGAILTAATFILPLAPAEALAALGSTANVRVQAFVLPPTCTISVEGGDMVSGSIDFGTLPAGAVSTNFMSTKKTFNAHIIGCPTYPDHAPVLKSNIPPSAATLGYGIYNDYQGNSGSIYAQGMGFFFRLGTGTSYSGDAYFLGNSTVQGIPLNQGGYVDSNTGNGDMIFTGGITCGTKCASVPKKAGQLKATIALSVEYP